MQLSLYPAASARHGVSLGSEVGIRMLTPLDDDCCALMPMSPPLTPLLEPENLGAVVSNLRGFLNFTGCNKIWSVIFDSLK